MGGLLGSFLTFLLLYKYTALFAIAFVAALLLPIPASSTLAAAGAFSSQGYMNIVTVILVALAANVSGDLTGYLIARYYGETTLNRIGFGRLLRSPRYEALRDYIFEFHRSVIYLSRFLTEVGPTVNILSGLADVPILTFAVFDVLGETSYVLLYGGTGYFLGNEWENNLGFFTKGALIILSLGLIVNSIQLILYRKRKKRK